MEKKKTMVHFVCAIMFVIFAVALFKIANGEATTDRFPKEDGSYDYGNVLALFIPFNLCIISLAGLIVVLQEGEFMAWLGSVGAILVVGIVGYIFDFMKITSILIGGVYAIWWSIVAIRNLLANWNSFYWENKLFALCRILLAVALISFVVVWAMLPLEFDIAQDMSKVMPICGWAGGFAIAAAVGLVIEGVLWIKCCNY